MFKRLENQKPHGFRGWRTCIPSVIAFLAGSFPEQVRTATDLENAHPNPTLKNAYPDPRSLFLYNERFNQ